MGRLPRLLQLCLLIVYSSPLSSGQGAQLIAINDCPSGIYFSEFFQYFFEERRTNIKQVIQLYFSQMFLIRFLNDV